MSINSIKFIAVFSVLFALLFGASCASVQTDSTILAPTLTTFPSTAIVTYTQTATKVPTRQPSKTPVPTVTPFTNEELASALGVTIVKIGNVDDRLVTLDLLGIKADQDYLIRHNIATVFPPIRLVIADSASSSINCEVFTKNGKITINQNVPRCYEDREPINWQSGAANEGMNIYFQFAVGMNSSSKFNTAGWIWVEGSANYFGWQALVEDKFVRENRSFHQGDAFEQGVYSVDDLLNANDLFDVGTSSNIGSHFMDYLIHKDGNDQKKIDENIKRIYDVFTVIGSTNIPDNKIKRQQIMKDAVLQVFGVFEENLYADFLAKMKK